jgi:hypothetical protein
MSCGFEIRWPHIGPAIPVSTGIALVGRQKCRQDTGAIFVCAQICAQKPSLTDGLLAHRMTHERV